MESLLKMFKKTKSDCGKKQNKILHLEIGIEGSIRDRIDIPDQTFLPISTYNPFGEAIFDLNQRNATHMFSVRERLCLFCTFSLPFGAT